LITRIYPQRKTHVDNDTFKRTNNFKELSQKACQARKKVKTRPVKLGKRASTKRLIPIGGHKPA